SLPTCTMYLSRYFFIAPAPPHIHTLSLHDALPIWSSPDPGLGRRVAWYEQATLVSKIHVLAFDRTRHPEADARRQRQVEAIELLDRKSTRLNSSHVAISYAVFCLKKKKQYNDIFL